MFLIIDRDVVFLERTQVIPTPKAEDFQIRLRDREREAERLGTSPVASFVGEEALDLFRDAIDTLKSAEQKEMLERVCDMAEQLEGKGLICLKTNAGAANVVLRLEIPNWDRALVYGYKKGGVGFLRLIGNSFESRAPRTKKRIEEIDGIGSLGRSRVLHDLPEGLLQCLADAYQEANEVR